MKRVLLSILILLGFVEFATAQRAGEIQGRVIDEKGEGIPFANVVAYRNDIQANGTSTDYEGYFSMKPLDPGNYRIVASYLGNNVELTGVEVNASKTTFLDDIVISTSQQLETVEYEYKEAAVDVGNTETGSKMSREEIDKMPKTDLLGIIGNSAGAYQGDDDQGISILGSRNSGTKFLIDGIDMSGQIDLPNDAIDEVEIITGGVDASQGDFTGGVVNTSTRGPSNQFTGTGEFLTSQFTDPYGYNEGRLSLLGPLYKKHKGTDSARTALGFLFAGEYIYEKESDPPGIPIHYVNDETLAELKANPLVASTTGEGYNKATEYVTEEDIVSSFIRKNNDDWRVNLFGKLDYKPTLTTNLTVGGTYFYADDNAYVRTFEMYNSENNPKQYRNEYRVYGKFTQRFPSGGNEEQTSGFSIGNAYYTIQVNYQRDLSWVEDRDHGRNPFDYGYIGKFNTTRQPVYQYDSLSIDDKAYTVHQLAGYQDVDVEYEPGSANPVLSRYTEQLYETTDPRTLSDIALGGGLRNGDFTQSLYSYSMWYNPGVPYTSYSNDDNTQFGGRFDASFDLAKSSEDGVARHSIEFGFEYEQRIERSYNVSPFSLWEIGRQVTNSHLSNLDTENPYFLSNGDTIHHSNYNGEVGELDSVFYYRRNDQSDQSYFDAQLRQKLGLPEDGLHYINLDNVDPDLLSIDMFSPEQLLNSGNRVVSVRGYDYEGNKLDQVPTFADYFYDYEDVNDNGEFDQGVDYRRRNIAAYRPIYTGAYIQDRFNIGEVVFRVGLRVDRFDANQKVLRDQYSLYPIHSAEEVDEVGSQSVTHPATIGDDYAVYVDDVQNPLNIVGYRDGDTWYNAEGSEISDPGVLANQTTTGGIAPFLEDPSADIKDPDNFDVDASFEDYEPQFTAMPRIAFSFPITETAMFTAHYDVLTQRPSGRNGATPYHYYYLQENSTGVIPNPNLKPEKTINYQLGFQQALSEKSALKISAFYREMRDMIQVTNVLYAYPIDYRTFGNVDFGTVKGLTLTYDMVRRIKNIMMDASYTLQFADGTGSNTTSQLGLINAGQPNLRTIVPLNNDVRHTVNVNIDYRLPGGEDYNGPVIGNTPILANAGVNLQLRGRSGEPYTRQAQPTPTAQFGVASRSQLEGSINGSRLPFTFKVDLGIDKDFPIVTGKRVMALNVYVITQNLLNARNVRGVYSYTGDPVDDGYLSSSVAQQTINAQVSEEAFIDQYTKKMRNPGNFALPRRVQVGAKLKF